MSLHWRNGWRMQLAGIAELKGAKNEGATRPFCTMCYTDAVKSLSIFPAVDPTVLQKPHYYNFKLHHTLLLFILIHTARIQ